jgi:hypothetical protein
MALYAVALTDAYIAVFDAKYHYEFWRPVTAIRNRDLLRAFSDEVAIARIWAGFHYRFSTRVGTAMGRSIGQYVVQNVMQPASVANAQ